MLLKDAKINFVPGDTGACGRYRVQQIGAYFQGLGLDATLSPAGKFRCIGEEVLFTQRCCSEKTLESMIKYKESTKAKLIIDYDDVVWIHDGETIPDYNYCRKKIDYESNTKGMKKLLNEAADVVTVTTDVIKESLKGFVDEKKIRVIPNMLNYSEWNFDVPTQIPSVNIFYYAASATHYPIDWKPGDGFGDFTKNMVDYLNTQKIVLKGFSPKFLHPIAVTKPSSIMTYARDMYNETRNILFTMAPLQNNMFNRAKSDLKYLESCAVGRVCLVSDFEGSPYSEAHEYQKVPLNTTPTGMKYIVERATDHYEEILKHQYEYLSKRWLNSNIKSYLEIEV